VGHPLNPPDHLGPLAMPLTPDPSNEMHGEAASSCTATIRATIKAHRRLHHHAAVDAPAVSGASDRTLEVTP